MPGLFPEDEVDARNSSDEFAAVDNLAKESTTETPKPEAPKDDNNDRIPAKYRGKSVEDIIHMAQEAERLMSRHADEVGFARRMAEAASRRLESDNGSSPKRADADQSNPDADFFARPKETVERTIANHPDVLAVKETARQIQAREAYNVVKDRLGKEPKDILHDPDFMPWVQENPHRVRSLQYADQTNDPDAAFEVLNNFQMHKQFKAAQTSQQQAQLTQQTSAAKRAAIVDGGSPATPSNGTIYRKQDIIDLQVRDPAKYDRLEAEILKAYAEGRVR